MSLQCNGVSHWLGTNLEWIWPEAHTTFHKNIATDIFIHDDITFISYLTKVCFLAIGNHSIEIRSLIRWLHHRPRGKTTTGSALDGAVFDIAQILAYLVHNMSRSQLYLGFGHFGWLPSFFGQWHFGGLMVKLYFLCWNYSLSSGWHIIAA